MRIYTLYQTAAEAEGASHQHLNGEIEREFEDWEWTIDTREAIMERTSEKDLKWTFSLLSWTALSLVKMENQVIIIFRQIGKRGQRNSNRKEHTKHTQRGPIGQQQQELSRWPEKEWWSHAILMTGLRVLFSGQNLIFGVKSIWLFSLSLLANWPDWKRGCLNAKTEWFWGWDSRSLQHKRIYTKGIKWTRKGCNGPVNSQREEDDEDDDHGLRFFSRTQMKTLRLLFLVFRLLIYWFSLGFLSGLSLLSGSWWCQKRERIIVMASQALHLT